MSGVRPAERKAHGAKGKAAGGSGLFAPCAMRFAGRMPIARNPHEEFRVLQNNGIGNIDRVHSGPGTIMMARVRSARMESAMKRRIATGLLSISVGMFGAFGGVPAAMAQHGGGHGGGGMGGGHMGGHGGGSFGGHGGGHGGGFFRGGHGGGSGHGGHGGHGFGHMSFGHGGHFGHGGYFARGFGYPYGYGYPLGYGYPGYYGGGGFPIAGAVLLGVAAGYGAYRLYSSNHHHHNNDDDGCDDGK